MIRRKKSEAKKSPKPDVRGRLKARRHGTRDRITWLSEARVGRKP
jgi:hypothetical protein